MSNSGIYMIKSNRRPERCYIGSTRNIQKRKLRHFNYLAKKRHHSIKLQRHYDKYGKSDLDFHILLECKTEELIIQEQYFIDLYKPYFNICRIAGSTAGFSPSEETREKISRAHKGERCYWFGKTHSEESKKKIGEASRLRNKGKNHPNYGKPMSEEAKQKIGNANRNPSEETRRKMSEANKRRIITDETKEKLRISHTGKIHSEETKRKMREIGLRRWEQRKKSA